MQDRAVKGRTRRERVSTGDTQRTQDVPGIVYFVTFDYGQGHDRVKIGYTENLYHRLANFETAVPFDMDVVATFRGTKDDEKTVHKRLKAHRFKREWYTYSDEVNSFIEDMQDAWLLFSIKNGEDYDATLAECMAYQDQGGDMDDWLATLSRTMAGKHLPVEPTN